MKHKYNKKKTWLSLFCLAITSYFSSDIYKIFRESDELSMSSNFRSPEMNQLVFNAITSNNNITCVLNTDFSPKMLDCGVSSLATSKKSDHIEDTPEASHGVAISEIASGLQESDIGSIILHLKDDDGIVFDLQIDKFSSDRTTTCINQSSASTTTTQIVIKLFHIEHQYFISKIRRFQENNRVRPSN